MGRATTFKAMRRRAQAEANPGAPQRRLMATGEQLVNDPLTVRGRYRDLKKLSKQLRRRS